MPGQTLLDTLIKLLFPDRCAGCRKLGDLFCTTCRAALVPYPDDRRAPPASLNGVQIAFLFQSPLREAIHQLKYRRIQRVAKPLGQLIAEHLAGAPPEIDAVIAIPLHKERLAKRGFNQAEALAREVACDMRRPLVSGQLVRTRATEQQAHLDARGRAENMRDAFAWQGVPPPRRLLIVDDVYTTGATMAACAEALRAAGADAIYGAALARSQLS